MTNEQYTREKLLEDVNALAVDYWVMARTWVNANDLKKDVIALLDRQATITERECLKAKNDELRECDEQRLEFRDQRDYLQAEVDRLEAAGNYDCATCDAKGALETERDDYKASMETLEANASLWREQADKLKAENKRLSDRVNGLLLELLIIAEKLGAENADNKKS